MHRYARSQENSRPSNSTGLSNSVPPSSQLAPYLNTTPLSKMMSLSMGFPVFCSNSAIRCFRTPCCRSVCSRRVSAFNRAETYCQWPALKNPICYCCCFCRLPPPLLLPPPAAGCCCKGMGELAAAAEAAAAHDSKVQTHLLDAIEAFIQGNDVRENVAECHPKHCCWMCMHAYACSSRCA